MKKSILIPIAILISLAASAQTQQGYVKTKGRMVNGKLVPGQGLKGATVSLHGRTAVLVNKDDGSFSFPVPESQFRVDSVRKKGYQLVDMDAISKTYLRSANPIYLVMETPEQQLQDQLAAERKIRRTLTDQLHQREDEIEALKEQQKISEEEYRQALQKLYEETDQNEQLVKDMVERYSTIDYDQLSEFDQRISEFILNGELVKADSLLRTKGDINERVEQYRKHEAINAKEKEELSQRQEQLEQSELLAQKELEDLANDCYRKFEICKMRHENDSAAYYIELRANLDSTKVEWLDDAGNFFDDYVADYNLAYTLFNKALSFLRSEYGENHPKTGIEYSNLGVVSCCQGDYEKALELFNKSIAILKSTFGENHPELCTTYNNIGNVYLEKGSYDMALEYYNKSLVINKSLFGENNLNVANCYNDIGVIHLIRHEYDTAIDLINKSLLIRKSYYGNDHPDVAACFHNLGSVYESMDRYEEALKYYDFALSICKPILGEKHPSLATVYNGIGTAYLKQKEYANALKYYYKALTIRKAVLGEKHSHVATCYNNIGYVYEDLKEYDTALACYNKALNIKVSVLGKDHPSTATSYYNLGALFERMGNYVEALKCYEETLTIYNTLYGADHSKSKKTMKAITRAQAKLKEQENEQKTEE